jgi:hypothetical protein
MRPNCISGAAGLMYFRVISAALLPYSLDGLVGGMAGDGGKALNPGLVLQDPNTKRLVEHKGCIALLLCFWCFPLLCAV